MRFPKMWYVRPAKAQTDQSLFKSLEYFMNVKLLTEHNLALGGCIGSFESTRGQNATLLEITCHSSYSNKESD